MYRQTLGVVTDTEYVVLTPSVEPPPPPPPPDWPVTRSVHIFDNFEVTSESQEILKNVTRKIVNVDTSVLIGGKIDYSILYTQGNTIPNPNVRVFFNDMEVVSELLQLNGSTVGAIDLTGLVKEANTIKIQVESTILMWAECFFDIWVTFGYSEEPATDPVGQKDWTDWIKDNMLLVGIVGIGALLLLTRGGPTITIIQPKKS
jgi:hypothetical protein